MVKKSKLLRKILYGSKNVRFDEFTRLLLAFGFTLERISGSHHVFSHPAVPQTIAVQSRSNGQAKPYQMRQFIKLIEKYHLELLNETDEGDT